ncbi:MAG: DUF5330 domain-containing protein [Pseudolabrys sp.]
MFFLLRMAFWLGVVCVLLPTGGAKTVAPAEQIDAAQAVTAATAAVSDMRGFCERQPDACTVGGKVAVAITHKAEAGARTLYEFFSEKLANNGSNGSDANRLVSVSVQGQQTLTQPDLAPAWHAPIPLPPRREAKASRPSA